MCCYTTSQVGNNRISAATIATTAPDTDRQSTASNRIGLNGTGNNIASVATTTTDTLRYKSMRIFTKGGN